MNPFRLSLLHSGTGYPTGWLHSDWIPDPTVVISAFLIAAAYLLYTGSMNQRRPDVAERPVTTKQRVLFVSGCVAFLIALGQPLDDWSDNYLLTAHMLQHLILMFAVAPLWMLGTPSWMLEPLTRVNVVDRLGYLLTRPVAAFIIGNAVMVLWHVPGVYNAALDFEPLHILQHGMFLFSAIIAWWPVIGPMPAWPKLESPVNCLYLFVYSIPGGILGAFITLGTVPFYDFYANVPRIFGISLEVDQQLAGTMMWVGSSSIYLLWITVLFFQWAGREDEVDRQTSNPVATRSASGVAP